MIKMNEFELKVLDFIQEHLRCSFLDKVLPIITKLGDAGIFWIIVAIVLLLFKKTRKMGIMTGLALLLGLIIGNLTLKPLVARTRPYDMPGVDINLLIERLSDKSFPSGHTLASFEAATVLLIKDKRFGIPAIVLASVIAFSRLYLYVHYPTDVLGGIVLGILIAFASCFIVNKVQKLYTESRLSKHK